MEAPSRCSGHSGGHVKALQQALEDLPLFPLPRLVFFPSTTLPLHVFEPRYRKMLADCLATHKTMAVVRLEPNERIAQVAGVGVVVHHELLPDGRSNLLLEGAGRVRLEELPFLPPYRRARATLLEPVHTPVAEEDRTALVVAATELVRELRRYDPEFSFDVPTERSAGVLADAA